MGGDDTNVPPYHLRRMARLVDQLSADPTHTQVSEIPGQGHWFNGVVDDAIMQKFFDENFSETLPALPDKWTVVTLNPASSEGKKYFKLKNNLVLKGEEELEYCN